MEREEGSADRVGVLRLRVEADTDPCVLVRILERFAQLNVTPCRVMAEYKSNDRVYVQLDVAGLSERHLALIAAKLEQVPYVIGAQWSRL